MASAKTKAKKADRVVIVARLKGVRDPEKVFVVRHNVTRGLASCTCGGSRNAAEMFGVAGVCPHIMRVASGSGAKADALARALAKSNQPDAVWKSAA